MNNAILITQLPNLGSHRTNGKQNNSMPEWNRKKSKKRETEQFKNANTFYKQLNGDGQDMLRESEEKWTK